jgi:hypothetical protein
VSVVGRLVPALEPDPTSPGRHRIPSEETALGRTLTSDRHDGFLVRRLTDEVCRVQPHGRALLLMHSCKAVRPRAVYLRYTRHAEQWTCPAG